LALNSRPVYQNGEFAQSTHVGYDIVYGSGHQAWEWTEEFGLRPVLYPMIFASCYKFLNILFIDFTILIIYLPHFIHIFVWQISDMILYKVVKSESYIHKEDQNNPKGEGYGKLTMLLFINCWLTNVFMPRTATNALEGLLLPIGLYFWKNIKTDNKLIDLNAIKLTVVIIIALILRPTSILAWLFPMIWKIFVHKTFKKFIF